MPGTASLSEGIHHSNTAENFFSILKRGVIGVYIHVSQMHLNAICGSSSSATIFGYSLT